jgi:acyl carrier protein
MNDINLKIRQIIGDKSGVDALIIKNEAIFFDDLGIDSLDFCEVIVDIEREFNISIPDDVYDRFNTVSSLADYVAQHAPQVV